MGSPLKAASDNSFMFECRNDVCLKFLQNERISFENSCGLQKSDLRKRHLKFESLQIKVLRVCKSFEKELMCYTYKLSKLHFINV